tara:strand:+ start:188 stop:394 length:207 start_codon:yes stop_codon:yes gene_type:complete
MHLVRVRSRLRPRLGLSPRLRAMVRVRLRVRSSSAHESRSQKPSNCTVEPLDIKRRIELSEEADLGIG